MAHHTRNIGEDGVILTLKDVVRCITFGFYHKCVVDETFTKGLDDFDLAFDYEVRCDVKHSFVHIICLFGISVNTTLLFSLADKSTAKKRQLQQKCEKPIKTSNIKELSMK